jgi:Putative homoserine kinase type II (protein kinase fold)
MALNFLSLRKTALLKLGASIIQIIPGRSGVSNPAAHSPTFFTRSDPTAEGFRWEKFLPHQNESWPGFLEHPSGTRAYGLYERKLDGFLPISPEADPALGSLARWFEMGSLVSYRVGLRATVRLERRGEGAPQYAKLLTPRKACKLEERTRMVLAVRNGADRSFPELAPLIESRPQEGVLVFAALPGHSLHDLLVEESPEVAEALGAVARALVSFHAVAAPKLPLLPAVQSPRMLKRYAALATQHFPGIADSYRSALDRISRTPQTPLGVGDRLVHGDFQDRNILVDGERIALLDLDRLHRGHPVKDVGHLVAHLILRALQRGSNVAAGRQNVDHFLCAYREAGGEVRDRELAAVACRALFRLACLYLFRRRWQGLTPYLLDEAVWWAGPAVRQ